MYTISVATRSPPGPLPYDECLQHPRTRTVFHLRKGSNVDDNIDVNLGFIVGVRMKCGRLVSIINFGQSSQLTWICEACGERSCSTAHTRLLPQPIRSVPFDSF